MKSLVNVRRCLFVIVAALVISGILPTGSVHAKEFNVYAIGEFFEWKEFNDSGSRLLKESGPRYGVGFLFFHEFESGLTVKPRVEVIGGKVTYDGQTQAGTPVKSKTEYINFKLETDLGYKFGRSGKASLEPFAGLGLRVWNRDIQDGTAADGTHAYGYNEEWTTLYLRGGLRGDVPVGEKSKLFGEVGVKYPLYNENTAYLSDVGGDDVTLHPGKRPSLFAEAGMKINHLKVSAYYDSMRFSKSDVVTSGFSGYYQPKSQADMFGVRLGVSF